MKLDVANTHVRPKTLHFKLQNVLNIQLRCMTKIDHVQHFPIFLGVDLPCSDAERGGFFSLNKDVSVVGSSLAQKVMSSCSIWLSHVFKTIEALWLFCSSWTPSGCGTIFHGTLPTFCNPNICTVYTYVYLFVYNGCWLESWLIAICYVVKGPLAAMSREIKLNTLQGSVITLDVPMTATVRELKMMLLEKHPCQDPIERKVLKVELLRDSSIIDDAKSLGEAGLVRAESPVTVTYARNEVEAVEQDDIHAHGYFALKIPSNVTNISNAAFKDLHELVLVTIPESVTHIGECAFQECDSLSSITLGESVTDIGEGAFAGCTSLASITLGESVTHIGSGAFQGCTSLASISLGESVTDIWQFTFYQCTSLASITLGESVTDIGECVWRLHLFGKHHFGCVCDPHWPRCVWILHLFNKHCFWSVCDWHWGLCLWRVHLSGEHYFGWFRD